MQPCFKLYVSLWGYIKSLISKSAKSTKQAILLTTWYFGNTCWSRFQIDQHKMQNCHLIQNDIKFQ